MKENFPNILLVNKIVRKGGLIALSNHYLTTFLIIITNNILVDMTENMHAT